MLTRRSGHREELLRLSADKRRGAVLPWREPLRPPRARRRARATRVSVGGSEVELALGQPIRCHDLDSACLLGRAGDALVPRGRDSATVVVTASERAAGDKYAAVGEDGASCGARVVAGKATKIGEAPRAAPTPSSTGKRANR